MAYFDRSTNESYYLIGTIGEVSQQIDAHDFAIFAEMAVIYIRYILGPPPNGTEITFREIHDDHRSDGFVVLVNMEESQEAELYARRAESVLGILAESVDWIALQYAPVRRFIESQKYITIEELFANFAEYSEPVADINDLDISP